MKAILNGDSQPTIRSRLHHWRLLWQYRGCYKGIGLILKNGDHVDLLHRPQPGEYTWETEKGFIDSNQVEAVIDRTAFGWSH